MFHTRVVSVAEIDILAMFRYIRVSREKQCVAFAASTDSVG